ncbi:oligoendopeptidase F [Candidatus Mycoplasma pogonae]
MKMKIYKKYSDIPEQYRFDLEYLLEGKDIDFWIKKTEKMYRDLIVIKDSKYDSSEAFLAALKKNEKLELITNKLHNYVSNKLNTNIVDTEMNQLVAKLEELETELAKEMGNESTRLFKNSKKVKQWLKLPEFAIYKKNLELELASQKHYLKPEIEEYVLKTSNIEADPESIFSILTDSEIDYGYAIDSKGKKHKITDGTYFVLLESPDEALRKDAHKKYLASQYKHRQSLAKLLIQKFKKTSVTAELRKYNSAVEALTYNDRVDEKLLNILFENIQKNMFLFHKFNDAKKKFFKLKFNKKMQAYDRLLKLVNIKNRYSVEESQVLVAKALEPMGKEYSNIVQKAFVERWVDYINVPNKRSGAYSIGQSYGLDKKYILMNFDYTLESVSTLAHEMGHSMHSYYSDKTQPQELASYPIFLAEIASIFNELMLTDYLLKNSKSDELRFFVLGEAIRAFQNTVVRQIIFAQYEYQVYKALDKKVPLSNFEDLEAIYEAVEAKYMSEKQIRSRAKAKDKKANIIAVTIPHYYYNFYVYKYALGYIIANAFFQKYKQDGKSAIDNYIKNFLSAGSRKWPVELLKDAGVDLYDSQVYNTAFKNLDTLVSDYIRLGNKIFNKKKHKK